MITGPVGTPYEHGLFVFDVRLPPDYPASPPVFYYLSQCSGRLNPNLYEDGKVCVSLLGTWAGRGSEVWTSKSNVLQVLVSIQGNALQFFDCECSSCFILVDISITTKNWQLCQTTGRKILNFAKRGELQRIRITLRRSR